MYYQWTCFLIMSCSNALSLCLFTLSGRSHVMYGWFIYNVCYHAHLSLYDCHAAASKIFIVPVPHHTSVCDNKLNSPRFELNCVASSSISIWIDWFSMFRMFSQQSTRWSLWTSHKVSFLRKKEQMQVVHWNCIYWD